MFTRVHDVEQMFGALNLFRHGMGECSSTRKRQRRDGTTTQLPSTNIYDYGDTLVFQAEIAGVVKDDLSIQLQGKQLEIKGAPRSMVPEGYTVHRQGRSMVEFSRSYTLPVEIDAERVSSSLENGILTLTLPKAEKSKKREITIQ